MQNTITIDLIPAFQDNYIWCLRRGNKAILVDPGDAVPAIEALSRANLELIAVFITHHHPDHVGGLAKLMAKWPNLPVYGPQNSVPEINRRLFDGDQVHIFDIAFSVHEVPGHTLDHVAYFAQPDNCDPILFCGDTLFAGGCGRLFEGSPEQMLNSLTKLSELPGATRVYCAHEYTLSNLVFASAVEPENLALKARFEETEKKRKKSIATVPSTIELERQTNPFLRVKSQEIQRNVASWAQLQRWTDVQIFAGLRSWKDNF